MTNSELQEQLRQRDARIKELEKQIQELKELLLDKAKESKPPKEASNFSVSRHEQKERKRRRRKKSTGRKPKDALARSYHGHNRSLLAWRQKEEMRIAS